MDLMMFTQALPSNPRDLGLENLFDLVCRKKNGLGQFSLRDCVNKFQDIQFATNSIVNARSCIRIRK